MARSEYVRHDEVVWKAGEGFSRDGLVRRCRGRSIGSIMRVGGHRGRGGLCDWRRASVDASLCVESSEKSVTNLAQKTKSNTESPERRRLRRGSERTWIMGNAERRASESVNVSRGARDVYFCGSRTRSPGHNPAHVSLPQMKVHFISIALMGLVLGANAGAVDLTANTFDAEVLESDKSAFVKFFAPWYVHKNRSSAFRQTRRPRPRFPRRFPRTLQIFNFGLSQCPTRRAPHRPHPHSPFTFADPNSSVSRLFLP